MNFIEKLDFGGDNPQPRFGHTVTFIDKHRAILFGGAVGDTGILYAQYRQVHHYRRYISV
jgi:hypothetical protein